MSNPAGFVEKRKHPRFRVKDRSFAVLGPDANKLCHMIDICRAGLSFRYFVDTDSNEPIGIDLDMGILYGDDFYLENIPAKVVAERVIENPSPFNVAIMKRCSVEFGQLTERQATAIEYFLESNTEGPA